MPELADTSAWARRRHPQVSGWWNRNLRARQIGVCDMVVMELLRSARSGSEMRVLRDDLSALPACSMSRDVWSRALDVYQLLADIGPQHHRSVKLPDLIIAACAEEAGWPLVHYDQDFDAIGAVTGQDCRWVAPRGSL